MVPSQRHPPTAAALDVLFGVCPPSLILTSFSGLAPKIQECAPLPPPLPSDLAAQIQDNVELVLQRPPVAAGRRGGGGGHDEVAELRQRIDADQRLLVQFAEEKVQLAVAGYDLLDMHLNQLDIDMHDLQEELAAVGGLGGWVGGVCVCEHPPKTYRRSWWRWVRCAGG